MLRVWLLAGVAAECDGEPMAIPPPAVRLLAFLALRPGPHDRGSVAAALWPNATDTAARANLRTAVWALRRAVGPDALEATRTAVGLVPTMVSVDAVDLLTRAEAGSLPAAEQVRGAPLLEAFPDDWAESARSAQRLALLRICMSQSDVAARSGDLPRSAAWRRQHCALEPLDEAAHTELVRLLASTGDRSGAVRVAREFADRLRIELDVAPGPALRAALAEARGPAAAVGAVGRAVPRPVFGRTRELRELTGAWSAARGGGGRVLLVTGEPGIGKTRLVHELARRAENSGGRTAIGAGLDVGGQTPLGVWQELVPQLARTVPRPPGTVDWPADLGRLAPDAAARLGRDRPPVPVASPELERLRLFDAVLQLVCWAAASRPVLLVAEDIYRADPMSLQLCAHIGRRLAGLPVLLVLTRRDRPGRPDADALLADLAGRGVDVVDVEVGPLSPSQVAAVARSTAVLDDAAVDAVVRAADGNPLLAVESARAVAAGVDTPSASLRVMVRAAVGALPAAGRDLVELLALAGRALSAAELSALGLADRDLAERDVLDTGLVIRVDNGLRFRHALLAEAMRADIGAPGARYERLAAAVGSVATTPGQVAAEVAAHLQHAGRDDLAGPSWQVAARYARGLGALADAARFWREAVRCDPAAAEPRLELAETEGWLGREDEFERVWQEALALLPRSGQAQAWNRRGKVLRTVVCRPTASLQAYERAGELLPRDAPDRLRADILIGRAWGHSVAGDATLGTALLDQVGDLVGEPDDATVAEMANARLMAVVRLGRFTECAAVSQIGGSAALRADRPDLAYAIWVHTACALSCAGDLEGALRATEQATEATRGIAVIELPCQAARAFVLSRLGRHEEAVAIAEQQLAIAERMDSPAFVAVARHDAGLIALHARRHDAAAALLADALATDAAVNRPAARLARAEALARCGRADEAAAEIRLAALEPVRAGDQPWALVPSMARVQGLVALARGDLEEARRRLGEAGAGWRRHLHHEPGSALLDNLVDLGRPPIAGLYEPARELRRIAAELRDLDRLTPVP